MCIQLLEGIMLAWANLIRAYLWNGLCDDFLTAGVTTNASNSSLLLRD